MSFSALPLHMSSQTDLHSGNKDVEGCSFNSITPRTCQSLSHSVINVIGQSLVNNRVVFLVRQDGTLACFPFSHLML